MVCKMGCDYCVTSGAIPQSLRDSSLCKGALEFVTDKPPLTREVAMPQALTEGFLVNEYVWICGPMWASAPTNRVALFESRTKILRTKKHKAKCLVLFVGADYETRPGRFCAPRHARGHRNSPPDCCYPGGLPCSSLEQRYYEQKSTRRNALCFLLERITRLELATSTLARWRSTR